MQGIFTMKRVVGATLSLAVLIGGALLFAGFSQPAAAAPSISWSPSAATVTLKPNTSTTSTYRITATETVAKAQFRVTPSLTPYLKVTPTTVTNLTKGQSIQVTVTLSLHIDASPDTITGTLQLREMSAIGTLGNNIAKPLPVTIVVQCPCLPPDPGPANDLTVEGIDSDNDGVRDDVQRALARRFGSTSDYPFAIAWAKIYQQQIAMPTPTSRASAMVLVGEERCAVQGASNELLGYDGMLGLMENTAARKQAMRAFNDKVLGYLGSELPTCAN
jgi:hypothetical protein